MIMRCAVSVCEHIHPQQAASTVAQSVYQDLGATPCSIAVVFASPHFQNDLDKIVDTIQTTLQPQVLIGCMGNGVIGNQQEFEKGPALTLWGLVQPAAQILPIRLASDFDSQTSVLNLGRPEWFEKKGQASCLLLADPFSTPLEELFARIEQEVPDVQVIGGFANGGNDQGDNRLILNREIYDSGVVGVLMDGGCHLRAVVSQGCRPIGERFVVTRADRNVLYELGGTSPIERLEATLKALSPLGRQQALSGIQVGIAMNEYQSDFGQGDFLIRGLLGANRHDGSLVLGDFLEEGQTIQFHIRDPEAASEDLKRVLAQNDNEGSKGHPQGALLFSCNGRGQQFFGTPHHDIAAIHEQFGQIPVAGFFAGGEFGPVGGKNYLHGYTASVALFYEG